MPRMFGTDGVRGLANRDLTAQLALDLGDAAVRVLGDDERSEFESRRRALVGRDTRVSGDFLAAALSAGMSAGGFDVIDAGESHRLCGKHSADRGRKYPETGRRAGQGRRGKSLR